MSTGNISWTPNTPKKHHEGETVGDTLTGHDKPMEEVHPQAPAALVFGMYPLALIVAALVSALVFWLMY